MAVFPLVSQRILKMRMLNLIALIVLAGCASQEPVRENVQPAQRAAQPANAVTPAALAAEKTDKFKVPPGYRPRKKDGETYYCKKETILGSRFPQEFCFTSAQLKELEANSAAQRREMQKGQLCGSATSICAGN